MTNFFKNNLVIIIFYFVSFIVFLMIFNFSHQSLLNLYKNNNQAIDIKKYYYLFLMAFGLLGILIEFALISKKLIDNIKKA